MSEQTGEITTQFAPSLPKKKDGGKKAGLRGALSGKEKPIASEAVSVEGEVQELFNLLLDKTEIEIDIHRQAQRLAEGKASGEEIENEAQAMGKQDRWKGKSPEELQAIAKKKVERKKVKELKQDATSEDPTIIQLTAERQAELIKSGQMRIPDLSRGIATEEVGKDVLSEDKKKLKEIEARVQDLTQNDQVIEGYKQLKGDRVQVLRKACEVHQGQSAIKALGLQQERMARQIFLKKRKYSPGEVAVIKRNQLIRDAIGSRIDQLKSDPEVFDLSRVRELQEYQIGLKTDRFAETPSRRRLLSKVRMLWAEGKKILATGPTGGGKTELFKHASLSMFDEEAEIIGGHELLTPYEIYGKMGGKKVGEKTQLSFIPGPLVTAIDEDRPVIFDEVNTIPNKILIRLKPDMNASVGQSITVQEENGARHKIGEGYAVGATANVKSEKHPDREKLDPALVRMFDSVYVDYFPSHELYDVMLASQMDVKGGLRLSSRDDLNAMADLCVATEWIQRAYQGKEVVTNADTGDSLEGRGGASTGKTPTLREAVLDPGRAMDMLSGWEDARTRGLTLREFVNQKIVSFVNNENYPEDDRYYLTEIFALRRFLRGTNANELHVSGLNQETLDTWNGFEGKKVVATDYYVKPEVVAKLDPFGVLKRPGGSEVDDLLGEDEFSDVEDEDSEIMAAPTFKKAENRRPVITPDRAGQTILIGLDKADISNEFDFIKRFAAYPKELVEAAKKNLSIHTEVAKRFYKVIEASNQRPELWGEEMWHYTSKLLEFVQEVKNTGANPQIAEEVARCIEVLDNDDHWKEKDEFDNAGQVAEKIDQIEEIIQQF